MIGCRTTLRASWLIDVVTDLDLFVRTYLASKRCIIRLVSRVLATERRSISRKVISRKIEIDYIPGYFARVSPSLAQYRAFSSERNVNNDGKVFLDTLNLLIIANNSELRIISRKRKKIVIVIFVIINEKEI